MSEGNAIQAKILIPGHLKDKSRKGPSRLLTFDILCDWIKLQGFDEYTTNGLIDLAANYPTSALPSFRRNFNLMIARVRQQRRTEQNAAIPVEKNKKENDDEAEAANSEVQG